MRAEAQLRSGQCHNYVCVVPFHFRHGSKILDGIYILTDYKSTRYVIAVRKFMAKIVFSTVTLVSNLGTILLAI